MKNSALGVGYLVAPRLILRLLQSNGSYVQAMTLNKSSRK
jgi:hypothetical protein